MKKFKVVMYSIALGLSTANAQEACRSVKDSVPGGLLTKLYELAEGTPVKDVLESRVKSETPYSLFLPTNAAIDEVPVGVVNALLADDTLRTNTLLDHVWPKKYNLIGLLRLTETLPRAFSGTTAEELLQFPKSVVGGDFYFTVSDQRDGFSQLFFKQKISWGKDAFQGTFTTGSANIVNADRDTCVGNVFLIDKVIVR